MTKNSNNLLEEIDYFNIIFSLKYCINESNESAIVSSLIDTLKKVNEMERKEEYVL